MVHVRQELAVHFFHPRPVGTVRILNVEVVALIAPPLVEDLLELLLRLEIHPEGGIDASLTRLRRRCRIHEEQVDRWYRTGRSSLASAAAASAASTIEKLAAVGAEIVFGDTVHERRSAAIAHPVSLQRAAAGRTAARIAAGFEVIHRCRDARAKV